MHVLSFSFSSYDHTVSVDSCEEPALQGGFLLESQGMLQAPLQAVPPDYILSSFCGFYVSEQEQSPVASTFGLLRHTALRSPLHRILHMLADYDI